MFTGLFTRWSELRALKRVVVALKERVDVLEDCAREHTKALAGLQDAHDDLYARHEKLRGAFYGRQGGRGNVKPDTEEIPRGDKAALRALAARRGMLRALPPAELAAQEARDRES